MTEPKAPRKPPSTGAVPHPDPLAKLAAGVDALRADVSKETASNELRVQASRRAKNRANAVAVLALAVGSIGVLVGVQAHGAADEAQDAADKAQEAIDLILEQRAESRAVTCDTSVEVATAINNLKDAMVTVVELAAAPNPGRSSESAARVEEFRLQALAALNEAAVGVRECTPEAIDAYYEGR